MASKYRVTGISELNPPQQKAKDATPATIGSSSPKELVKFVAQLLSPTYLSDEFYFIENLALHKCWPTFTFLKRQSTRGQIKIHPVALADYLPIGGMGPEHELTPIWDFCESQVSEIVAIRSITAALEKGVFPKPDEIRTPMAAAFAGYFFRGSSWFSQNQTTLLDKIKKCPWASFVALNAGIWPACSIGLIKSICEVPRLGVELFTHPITHQLVQIDCLPGIVADNPHLELIAAGGMQATDDVYEAFWLRFVEHADTAPMAAAFCLALIPSHKKAKAWIKLIKTSNRATYWFSLAFRKNNQMGNFSHLVSLYEKILDIPQWDFHFVRELDQHAAISRARRIWPDPWAVEMIEDLKLPFEEFQDLFDHSMNVDYVSQELKDSLILWAADYCASEAKKNEDPDDEDE